MPKHTPFLGQLPKFLQYREYEVAMFFFVRGVQAALPSTGDMRALELFVSVHGIGEDDMPLDSMIVKLKEKSE